MPEPIIIVDYNPHWTKLFEELRVPVASVLGDLALTIEHVGSTSVPRLPAKPIIDMDVVVTSTAHILYVCAKDSEALRRHLSFRNYLLKHPDEVQRYGRLKQEHSREIQK